MLKKTMQKAALLAVITSSTLTGGVAVAASASATASILGLDGGSLLSFSNHQYVSDASTPFERGLNDGNTLQNYHFNNTATNGDTSFASIDDSFSPFPHTTAGAINNGTGTSTVLWSVDWTANSGGAATVDLNYLYSATVKDLNPGETGVASSFIGVFGDGIQDTQEALYFFNNANGNTSGEDHLMVNFDVNAGDTGTFLVTVASNALVTPVPVPGAFWLLGSALAGLAAYTRRKAA